MSINKIKLPTSAVIAVTYRCNSRCQMCNIWQTPTGYELKPTEYLKLPAELGDINITGGEPFLRNDLLEIIDNIFTKCNPRKLVISSNGYLSERIIAVGQEILKKDYHSRVTIALSLDGIGDTHDKIRGVPGAFDLVLASIKGLQTIGFKNIGLGFTFLAGNENCYEAVYNLAKNMNLNFGATIAHNAEHYFSTQANCGIDSQAVAVQVNKTINEKIGSFAKNELGKCYFLHGLIFWSKTNKSILPCAALSDSIFLDPEGNIYPCNILNIKIGNLTVKDFDDIWTGEEAEKARKITTACPHPCWMVCTGKPAIKKHWLKAGIWILNRKVSNLICYSKTFFKKGFRGFPKI